MIILLFFVLLVVLSALTLSFVAGLGIDFQSAEERFEEQFKGDKKIIEWKKESSV